MNRRTTACDYHETHEAESGHQEYDIRRPPFFTQELPTTILCKKSSVRHALRLSMLRNCSSVMRRLASPGSYPSDWIDPTGEGQKGSVRAMSNPDNHKKSSRCRANPSESIRAHVSFVLPHHPAVTILDNGIFRVTPQRFPV